MLKLSNKVRLFWHMHSHTHTNTLLVRWYKVASVALLIRILAWLKHAWGTFTFVIVRLNSVWGFYIFSPWFPLSHTYTRAHFVRHQWPAVRERGCIEDIISFIMSWTGGSRVDRAVPSVTAKTHTHTHHHKLSPEIDQVEVQWTLFIHFQHACIVYREIFLSP